jgi:RNA polymerase sigma-70 factor (ECF subfamily)
MSARKRSFPELPAWSVTASGAIAETGGDRPWTDAGPAVAAHAAGESRAAGSLEISPAGAAEAAQRERRLVLSAQRGEADAVRALYDAYRERIWTLILFSLGDVQQAQDVLQSVFFKVFRGLGSFRFESSLFTWIYRIARNECWNDRRRRAASLVPLEAILGSRAELDSDPLGNAPAVRAERDLALEQAVMRLPLKMREVIVLKYMEGLSYEEMSRALGCAAGTVASRLNRALAELQEFLRPLRGRL